MEEHGFLEDEKPELSRLEHLVLDIIHIITCLYKFSIAIQYPAPKERLDKIELIDVSHFEGWDIKHIDEMFCLVDSQNNPAEARYLIERLGKANTRRRQLLKYYEAHHQKICRYIDAPLPIRTTELVPAPKPMTPDCSAPASDINPASTTKSGTTLPTVKDEQPHPTQPIQPIPPPDDDQVSTTSYATSINHPIRIRIPGPPDEIAAFEGEPFQCPYCFKIIEVRGRPDWKYVRNHAHHFCGMLTFLESMFLKIFSRMSAHS